MNKIENTKPILFMLVACLFNLFYLGFIYNTLTLPLYVSGVLAVLLLFPYTFLFVECFRKKKKNPDDILNVYVTIVFLCNLVFILSEVFLRCCIKLSTVRVILNSLSLTVIVFFILQLAILKKRTPIMVFCLTIAIVNFLDVYSDGFLIKKTYELLLYSGLLYSYSKDMSIDLNAMKKLIIDTNIDDIREFIKALLLVSTSIIAVDRVWNLKTSTSSVPRKDK